VSNQSSRIVVTDINISFGRLVALFVKFGLAAIPAAIILTIVLGFLVMVLGAILAAFGLVPDVMGGRPI